MRAPAAHLSLLATALGFNLATSAKQFAPASSIGVPAKGRIDFYKDILNGYEVMAANPLLGGDGKRGRKADAKSE